MLRTVRSFLCCSFIALCLTFLLSASLARVSEAATLTIITTDGSNHDLNADKIATLPQHSLETHTAWTQGLQHFDGVLLRDILASAGITAGDAKEKVLVAVALNGFRVEIPASDAFQYDVLIAQKLNGKVLTRRDKGPFWIVYPRDQHSELNDSRYDHRWAWQLKQLQIQ